MPAVNVTYSVALGATIYAGMGPPADGSDGGSTTPPDGGGSGSPGDTSWVPALGTIADISLNTLELAKGDQLRMTAATRSWSGCAFARHKGKYGWILFMGGGHGDGQQNWIMALDIETRQFFILKRSTPNIFVVNQYVGDTVTGWMWGDAAGTTLQEGEPFSSHFYAFPNVIEPGMIDNDPNGYLVTPGRGSMPNPGQKDTSQAHKFLLDGTATKWSMLGTPLLDNPGHGPSIVDPVRKRIVVFRESNSSATTTHPYMDLVTGGPGTLKMSELLIGYYAVGAYHAAKDLYMSLRCIEGGVTNLRIVDPKSGATLQVAKPVPVGEGPDVIWKETSSGGIERYEPAYDWVEEWQCWVVLPFRTNDVFYLKCSGSNPMVDPWVWSKTTLTGTVRQRAVGGDVMNPNGSGGNPYNRLRYVPKLGTFIWIPDYDVPAQAFTIPPP